MCALLVKNGLRHYALFPLFFPQKSVLMTGEWYTSALEDAKERELAAAPATWA